MIWISLFIEALSIECVYTRPTNRLLISYEIIVLFGWMLFHKSPPCFFYLLRLSDYRFFLQSQSISFSFIHPPTPLRHLCSSVIGNGTHTHKSSIPSIFHFIDGTVWSDIYFHGTLFESLLECQMSNAFPCERGMSVASNKCLATQLKWRYRRPLDHNQCNC